MLQSHTPSSSNFIAALSLLANDDDATRVCRAHETSHTNPMLEPSVAEAAGLSRFVYIIGHSEIRYVFSSIQNNQVSLYSEAVFVVIEDNANENLWVGDYSSLIAHLNKRQVFSTPRIYVHLLAEGTQAKSHVISDLFKSANTHCYC
jgi:hypothetical protein